MRLFFLRLPRRYAPRNDVFTWRPTDDKAKAEIACKLCRGAKEEKTTKRDQAPPSSQEGDLGGDVDIQAIVKQLNSLWKLYKKKERHHEGNAHTLL